MGNLCRCYGGIIRCQSRPCGAKDSETVCAAHGGGTNLNAQREETVSCAFKAHGVSVSVPGYQHKHEDYSKSVQVQHASWSTKKQHRCVHNIIDDDCRCHCFGAD